jgi:uncharacterized membrane protein YozB (DUF420 family)
MWGAPMTSRAVVDRAPSRQFYTWVAIGAALIVFVGFARSYYLDAFFYKDPIPLLLHVHGAVLTLWFVLFLVQVRLVANGRVDLHRRLGVFAAVVAGMIVVMGGAVAFLASRREFLAHPNSTRDLVGFKVSAIVGFAILCGFLLNFSLFVGLALCFRRRADIHKRLMLLATCSILGPALMRIFLPYIDASGIWSKFALYDVCAFIFIAFDTIRSRRLHPAFAWGWLFLLASFPALFFIGKSEAGAQLGKWLLTR